MPKPSVAGPPRLYRALLLLYPTAVRRRFGSEMSETFRRVLEQPRHRDGRARAWLWIRTAVEMVYLAVWHHVDQRRRRGHPLPQLSAAPSPRHLELFMHDLRLAVRSLTARPGFSAAVIMTLALGIGGNAAIFSVVNGVLLRPLPYDRAHELGIINSTAPNGFGASVSIPNYLDWRDRNRAFAQWAAMFPTNTRVVTTERADVVETWGVMGDFFETLGVPAALGRTFTAAESEPGAAPIVVLSHRFWTNHFGASPDVIGRSFTVGPGQAEIVGVMPPAFQFPDAESDMYLPLGLYRRSLPWTDRKSASGTEILARLAPGISPEDAQLDLDRVGREIAELEGAEVDMPTLTMLDDWLVGDVRRQVWLLMGAVTFVLLIACANVANLLLARGEHRQREVALRYALGADRSRIVRQLLTESLLYGVVGGAVGVVGAAVGLRFVVAMLPSGIPTALTERVGIDATVLGFTLLISALTAVGFGMVPALRTSHDLASGLRDKARGSTAGGGRLRNALIVVEVASSLVLLVGAGLLIRSMSNLQAVDKGFDATGVLTLRLAGGAFNDVPGWEAFHAGLEERVRALPGVQTTGVTNLFPLSATNWERSIGPDNDPTPEGRAPTLYTIASPGYFEAVGIPILRGRAFTDADRAGAPLVAIIDDMLAERFWPGEDPIGRRVTFEATGDEGNLQPLYRTVVGVAQHTRNYDIRSVSRGQAYAPIAQTTNPGFTAYLIVRGAGDPVDLIAPVRAEIRAIDPSVAAYRVRTLGEVLATHLSPNRAMQGLVTAFGAVALLLAAIGMYGVISYTVSQRTREIGVRMALGGTPQRVVGAITRQGLLTTVIGVGIGAVGAAWLTRFVSGLLFEVEPFDPAVVAVVAFGLLGVGLAAAYLPARRASRVHPAVVLREE